MSSSASRARAGFSLLEVAVVAALFGVLAFVLLTRLQSYRRELEQAMVTQTAQAMRAALRLRAIELQAGGRAAELPQLAGQNPIEWLAEKPVSYVGEYYRPRPGLIAPGQWYFDKSSQCLVYLLNQLQFARESERKQLNFKIKMVHNINSSHGKAIVSMKETGDELSLVEDCS